MFAKSFYFSFGDKKLKKKDTTNIRAVCCIEGGVARAVPGGIRLTTPLDA
jgi:hypothetical protein